MQTHDAAQSPRESTPEPVDGLIDRVDSLVEQAAALKEHHRELHRRAEELAGGTAASAAAEAEPVDPAEGIRSVARSLALGGATRQEVIAYLEETFGDYEHQEILDEFFPADGEPPPKRRRRFVRRR